MEIASSLLPFLPPFPFALCSGLCTRFALAESSMSWVRLLKATCTLAVLSGAGLAAGICWSVQSARSWPRFTDPEGLWAASFPQAPLAEERPAPAPFVGKMRTWTASTERGSFQLALVDGAALDGGARPDPLVLAAETARILGHDLELEGGGYFHVDADGGAVYGRVLADSEGRVFRLLATTPARTKGERAPTVRLFLETVEIRSRNDR